MLNVKYWMHHFKLSKLYMRHYLFHRFHKIPVFHEKKTMKTYKLLQNQSLHQESKF